MLKFGNSNASIEGINRAIKKAFGKINKKNVLIDEEIVKKPKIDSALEKIVICKGDIGRPSLKEASGEIDIESDDLIKAIIYTEILGRPKCKSRGGRRNCNSRY